MKTDAPLAGMGALAGLWPAWDPRLILFEDDDLIVVDKPSGLPTHAPEPGRVDDAHSRLRAFLKARGEADPYLGIHQRLDGDTSGVLLFTRRKEANRSIAEQFEGRRAEKRYVAGVVGAAGRGHGVLEHRIVAGRDGTMRAMRGKGPGQPASTSFRVLERVQDRALLELVPTTGRTHQLRVQLAEERMPIAGDPLYADAPRLEPEGSPARPSSLHAPRLLLHAAELRIVHPSTGRKVAFRAGLPPVFTEWLRGLAGEPFASVASILRRMREAAAHRYGVVHDPSGTTAFRLVNGAGDGLPGVTVDVYGEHLVVAFSSEEADAAREAVLDAAAALGAKGVYAKSRPKHASVIVDTRRETVAPREASRGESAPDPAVIHELGLPFSVRLGDGLSTGIFLDQRENRRRVRELAKGARVLNLFAYTGAFTVAAVAGGARASVTVDVSPVASAWARRNLEAVGANPARHTVVEADVLVWLKAIVAAGERFDLVLLDPPSFATTKKTRFSAASDYRKVAALALGALAPSGKLLACTNHRGIFRPKFRRFLHEAARDAEREVVQLKDLPDPVDFPPEPGGESHLKSALLTLGSKKAGPPR